MMNAHKIKLVFTPQKGSKHKLTRHNIADALIVSEHLIEEKTGAERFITTVDRVHLYCRRIFGGCSVLLGDDKIGEIEYR